MEYPKQWAESERQAKEIDLKKQLDALQTDAQLIPFNKYIKDWIYSKVIKKVKPSVEDRGFMTYGGAAMAADLVNILIGQHNDRGGFSNGIPDYDYISLNLHKYPEVFEFLTQADKIINGQIAAYKNTPIIKRGTMVERDYVKALEEYGEIDE